MSKALTIIAVIDNNDRLSLFVENIRKNLADNSCELIFVGERGEIDTETSLSYTDDAFEVKSIICNGSIPEALNKALYEAQGEIIHLTKTSCNYTGTGIAEAIRALSDNSEINIVSLDPVAIKVNRDTKNLLNFKKKFDMTIINKIDLVEHIDHWCRALFALFIKRDFIDGCAFKQVLDFEYERAFIAGLMARCEAYYLLPQQVITDAATDWDYYNYAPMYTINWYLKELKTFADIVLKIDDPKRLNQRILADLIKIQFAANGRDKNKGLLQGEKFDEYLSILKDILQNVDDDIITYTLGDMDMIRVPILLDKNLLCLKYGVDSIRTNARLVDECFIYSDGYKGKRYFFTTDAGAILGASDYLYISVMAINKVGNKLIVDAELNNTYFDEKEEFEVTVEGDDGTVLPVKRTQAYSLRKFFGVTVYNGFMFQFELPLTNKKTSSYKLIVKIGDAVIIPEWHFIKPQARLKQQYKRSFWEIDGRTIKYNNKARKLVITKSNVISRMQNEIAFWKDISKNAGSKSRCAKFIALRLLYYITKPYYRKKNIWLTFDQLFKGGDNGEYFFRYVNDLKNKDQKLYYVVNKNTKEYKTLSRKYDTVLDYASLKHKLIALHTKIMFTTRADIVLYAGFAKSAEAFFRGLYNFDVVCLQHGLSIQQIAQYQNRLYDNLKYYFCVSKYEIANLSKPIYGYDDKSMLQLTGAPRYDGLSGEAKKQIIISPTWRRNVTAGSNTKGSNHKYSVNFKQTKYFQIYNALINDPKLLECAQRTGYKLIYLIHPILSPQIDDFDKNDILEIVPGSKVNYEKILVESALMLTDHSGIMYDFAYQRKPLVYYHPDELPPQYAEGGLDYETMGFGPVCKTHESVVDELCKLMENNCTLDPKYADRIEDFFEYDDRKNCERVYQAAKEYEKLRASY